MYHPANDSYSVETKTWDGNDVAPAYEILSDNGQQLLFSTPAAGVISGQISSGTYEAYQRNLQTGNVIGVSYVDPEHTVGTGTTQGIAQSSDGRLVLYDATVNGQYDLYLRDTATGSNTIVSYGPDGQHVNLTSPVAFSGNGRYVTFGYYAANTSNVILALRDIQESKTIIISDTSRSVKTTPETAVDNQGNAYFTQSADGNTQHQYEYVAATGQTRQVDTEDSTSVTYLLSVSHSGKFLLEGTEPFNGATGPGTLNAVDTTTGQTEEVGQFNVGQGIEDSLINDTGDVVLITFGDKTSFDLYVRSGTSTSPPPQSTRYVALGDSVPYGHGLVNPYPTSQVDLPADAVQQGPSIEAYPALVEAALHLHMDIRSDNCTLSGDDLAISGATAAQPNARPGNNQCVAWQDSQSVQTDELPAADLASHPAKLVTIQAGADDINFGQCMAWELTKFSNFHAVGTRCVKDGLVTPALTPELGAVRSALTKEIEQVAPYAEHIAVLNYYQVIPKPTDFRKTSIFSGNKVNPVCWGLSHNLQGAYNDAVVLQTALNVAIDSAVSDVHGIGINNVQLVDLTNLEDGHEMCTGNSALFSGNLMLKSHFNNDLMVIGECHGFFSQSCQTTYPIAVQDLDSHRWQAAHPNKFGQHDIASKVEAELGSFDVHGRSVPLAGMGHRPASPQP